MIFVTIYKYKSDLFTNYEAYFIFMRFLFYFDKYQQNHLYFLNWQNLVLFNNNQ
jgi:hypothetical protein